MKTERRHVVKVKCKELVEARSNDKRHVHASVASWLLSVSVATGRPDIRVGQLARSNGISAQIMFHTSLDSPATHLKIYENVFPLLLVSPCGN